MNPDLQVTNVVNDINGTARKIFCGRKDDMAQEWKIGTVKVNYTTCELTCCKKILVHV